ncbi:hypothetical protein N7454_002789 [Penicillium verhagenii]|nr:hypothetical protein N7454_002789 [Penicillium verhagenii]
MPGYFASSNSTYSDIWALGPRTQQLVCFPPQTQTSTWDITSLGAYIRGQKPATTAKVVNLSNYTLSFDTMIDHGGTGWRVDTEIEAIQATGLIFILTNETEHGKFQTICRDAKGKFISGGLTGIVELLDDGTVIKSPFPDADLENNILDIAKEASIYHRLGPHERLIRVLGHSRDGLVLEYMKNGDLKTYLRAQNSIPMSLKLKWAFQISQSVSLLHRNGIIHCDIKPGNLLLDAALDIKIIDFSGSSLDGCKSASGEGTRFYLPRHWRDPPTLATDLFALGSTLYEVFDGSSPYEDIPSDQVEVLYKKKEFPNVSEIPCGNIIKQCWLSQVDSAENVQAFIQAIILSKIKPDLVQCDPTTKTFFYFPSLMGHPGGNGGRKRRLYILGLLLLSPDPAVEPRTPLSYKKLRTLFRRPTAKCGPTANGSPSSAISSTDTTTSPTEPARPVEFFAAAGDSSSSAPSLPSPTSDGCFAPRVDGLTEIIAAIGLNFGRENT